MKSLISWTLIAVVVCYWVIAGITFQIRNPIANQMQTIMHFTDVVTWRKLPEFQHSGPYFREKGK